MKSNAMRRMMFAGGFLFLVACFAGCQNGSDGADYQEYSALEGAANKISVGKIVPEPGDSQAEPIPPAVAEKSYQPAVAEAAPNRPARTEMVSVDVTPTPREIKLLVPEKRFSKASADGTLRVTYDDLDLLKILNMEPVPLDFLDYLPDWLERLDGKRIRIRGFMMPAFQAEDLKVFQLARDNEICCFTREAKLYDLINVRMAPGTSTKYIPQTPFDVEGTFHIVPPEPDEEILIMIYQIEDAKVITGRSR